MNAVERADRISTGVEGLDIVLCGGLQKGSVYIVQGQPGGGKTILANQICFRHARGGGRAVYITLLSESHDKMLKYLQQMDFFDATKVPDEVYYESSFGIFENEGLDGLLKLFTSESQARKADLLVLDGLFVIEEKAHNEAAYRRFVNEAGTLAHVLGLTIVLLTNSKRTPSSPEYTMVDGWMEVGYSQVDYTVVRHLQVYKTRGSNFISGRHAIDISRKGVTVHPRLESMTELAWPRREHGHLSTGIGKLDEYLGGGLEAGAAGVLAGPTGVGKTILGLHFISKCSKDEPGLIFGFYEDPGDLIEKAAKTGVDLEKLIREGVVDVLWNPPVEVTLDDLGARLLGAVRRMGARRVLVDGVEAFRQTTIYPGRIGRFLTALVGSLRMEVATTLFTLEVEELVGRELNMRFGPVSAVTEYIIMMRYSELMSEIHRTLTIVKTRNSAFDAKVREFRITSEGIRLGEVLPAGNDPPVRNGSVDP